MIPWLGTRAAGLVGPGTWMLFALLFSLTGGVTVHPVAPPDLDLSDLGQVVLTGDFDAISLYTYAEQNQNGFSTNGTQSLIVQLPDGGFLNSATTDASIKALCPFVLKNGNLAGVIVGGNFTSLGGIEAQGIALYDTNKSQVTPLPGLSGHVSAILCDQATNTVYVGGDLSGGNSTNAIAWVGMTGWANLPFAGFNGPVNSIAKAANGNVIFGGSFTGLGNTTTPMKKHQQVINISTANITSGSSASQKGFGNPRNIVCNSDGQSGAGNTWLIEDGSPGFWRAEMSFGYEPSMLRMRNTRHDGRGTQTFRFTALPSGGIMNLTYTDPSTKKESVCDALCPLDHDLDFQDFHFVNNVGMDGFQIDVSDWYGLGGGLNGIELFQNEIYAYAVDDLNEPTCASIPFPSNATTTGPWTTTPSGNSTSQYLTVDLTSSSAASDGVTVVFEPDIKQSGNYSVTLFTPGCRQDDTCDIRGIVNVTGVFATGTKRDQPVQSTIYQTNYYDKYDEIYHGYVDANSDAFRVRVTLKSVNDDQQIGNLLVAQRVRFAPTNSTGGLNGLFEFNPNEPITEATIADSIISESALDLDPGATVRSVIVVDDVTYVAGNFSASTKDFQNVYSISKGKYESLPNRGLDAEVSTIVEHEHLLYLGGNFTNTGDKSLDGLNNIAIFNISSQSWHALGDGVNGRVKTIVPIILNVTRDQPETCITVNGDFDKVRASGIGKSFSVDGFAIWVPSRQNWLESLNLQTQAVNGKLSASTDVPGSTSLLAGTIAVQAMGAGDAVALTSGPLRLNPLPVKIQPRQPGREASRQKRAVSGQNVTGIVTGLFYKSGDRNITVLGGHFTADATNGSTIQNLAFVDQSGSVTGVESGLDSDSVFLALATQSNILYAGGTISGRVEGNNVNGLILYDLAQNNYASPQPPAFGGDDVAVNSITVRPKTNSVYVGGNFATAGGLDCPSVCRFEDGQWSPPGTALGGSVAALLWQGKDKLLAGGNLTVNGNATSLATYDSKRAEWTALDGASSDVPGPVTALSPANNDASQFWVAGKSVNGSAFLMKYDGSKLRSLSDAFGDGTTIRGLSILDLKKNHESSDLVDRRVALLVAGELNLPNFGNVSAALFNGSNFTPFILSTSANGPGSISQLFSEKVYDFKSSGGHKALGLVVLAALACALGAIFLLIVAGIFVERYRRKREGYVRAPTAYPDKTSNIGRIPPEYLFGRLEQGYRADAPMI